MPRLARPDRYNCVMPLIPLAHLDRAEKQQIQWHTALQFTKVPLKEDTARYGESGERSFWSRNFRCNT